MTKRLFLSLGVLATLAAAPVAALAAPKPAATPAATKPAATPAPKMETPKTDTAGRPVPFHGKVTAVDAAAKTFSIHGKDKDRVFNTTEETAVIGKDGAAATIGAIPMGEEVRGSAIKSGETWTAKKVIIGAKEAATPATKGKGTATPAPAKL